MSSILTTALILSIFGPPEPVLRQEMVYYDYLATDGSLTGGRLLMPMPVDPGMPRSTWNWQTIIDSGPSDNRIDLVFVGDGYQAEQLGLYASHTMNALNDMFAIEPFATYASFFNVHRVDVVSTDSGVDNDPNQGVSRNTALDMAFWCSGIERLLCVSVGKALLAARSAPQVDQVAALANSTKYGGAGYTSSNLATCSGGNAAAPQVMIHEFGHSIGDLADEYDYGGPTTYTGPEPAERNVSIYNADQMATLGTKWADWLSVSRPDFDNPVGTYEGAYYSLRGIYRPSNNSMMRSLGRPFNLPSAETLILSFYDHVDPIDASTPMDTVLGPNDLVFVTPVEPLGHDLDITWRVDNTPVQLSEPELALCPLQLQPGVYVLSVTVVDNTPLVRDEQARTARMSETRQWVIHVAIPPADRNGDGLVDFFDVQDFLDDFAARDPSADLNSDGVIDFFDVQRYLQLVAQPCPGL
ncbi:MAG: hypothetical protein KJZ65_04960 [Phycisphaerales bacterium]|nr:hypothetical protein [Phycisphaerales bacterium]